ncbi:MFS transporter [Phenylobacterium terrae]|uniref:MFS transporter n=1 Tax=Phenylobacterium terrae TaxID=2665495 RepID=A0ABW4N1H3_9CAUL
MTQTATAPPRLSFPVKLVYGFGSIAYGLKNQLISSLLLLYYNQLMGVPAHIVSLALSASLILDALWDPFLGFVSDGMRTRWGRRHPLMYLSAAPFALSFILLWHPPAGLSDWQMFGWLLVFVILSRATISLYEVPSSALAPELAPDYHERTGLLGYRLVFNAIGAALAAVLAYGWFLRSTPDQPMGQLNAAGYSPYAVTVAAITVVVILVSTAGTHHTIPRLHIPPKRRTEPGEILRELVSTLSNRNFLVLLCAGAFIGVMLGMVGGLTLYFSTYFWELPSSKLLILMLAPLFATPVGALLARLVSQKVGKRSTAMLLGLGGITVSLSPIVLRLMGLMPPNGSDALLWILAAAQFLATSGISGAAIMLTSMLADTVEENQVKTGRRSEALLLSADSTLQRLAQGLSVIIPGALLTAVGFPEGAKPGQVDPQILNNLALAYVPTVYIAILIAAGVLFLYRLDKEGHERNLATIRETAAVTEAIAEADPLPAHVGPVGVQSRPV